MRRILFCLMLCISAANASEHRPASATGTGVCSLDVCAVGDRVHLLIARRHDDGPPTMEYLGSDDGGATWSVPVAIETRFPPEPAKRGADVQIAAFGQRIIALWTSGSETDRFGRGPLASAISSDGGKTWQDGPNPADDNSNTGHAFVDLTADSSGAFHAVWIDARPEGTKSKGLRYSRSTDGGQTWSANVTLDPKCCECCWNCIRTTADGRIHVLYRDADPRDMAMVSSSDSGKTWSDPVTVGAFGWEIDGCPHVGGGIAFGSSPQTVFATVWTAKDHESTGAYLLRSSDAGSSWSAPVRLGSAGSWHSDIAADDRRLAIVWDALVDNRMGVFVSFSEDDGRSLTPPVRISTPGVSASHPRIMSTSRGFVVFWTEHEEKAPVKWASQLIR